MAIRITKVIKDLNVGFQTIKELLDKYGIYVDDSISAQITDDVYEILVGEFVPKRYLEDQND